MLDLVKKARDETIGFIREKLVGGYVPVGRDTSLITKNLFENAGFREEHFVGHSLGTKEDHGEDESINPKNRSIIPTEIGHTIEPGIYIKNKFGVRSEINFYIDKNMKLIITTPLQTKLTLIF